MRALIYCRVSTDAQERDGTSLHTQEAACLAYAQQQGWSVSECIRDSASGYSLDRPGLTRARQLLREGRVDMLLAHAVDRLSRHQNHVGILFEDVQDAGAHLAFVTETFEDNAIGRFILAARAFSAEVEREKITERTTRGKLQQARNGHIPQGMGRGTYGYNYNKVTKQREIEPYQAEVVRRIFQRYAETRSFSKVSNELSDDGILAFSGGPWYPITIRRMLQNESYTGRLIVRKTKWVAGRSKSGKKVRRPVNRPAEEHIEIPGASPAIISTAIFERVQTILDDPARTATRPTPRVYGLRGRATCGLCGSAMVGKALQFKGGEYRYYQCRHAYDKRRGHACGTRYVRADRLEQRIWDEVSRVLAAPTVVLHELEEQRHQAVDAAAVGRLKKRVASLRDQEQRLVRLYALGEVDDTFVSEQAGATRRERQLLEGRLKEMNGPGPLGNVDQRMLSQACAAVAEWVQCASAEDRRMALEALQVAVTVTREAVGLSGVLPVEAPPFITDEPACPCTLPGEGIRRLTELIATCRAPARRG